jgi:hypothetical protein
MKLEKLSKEELVKLKEDIDNRLKTIKIKTTKPKNGTILSLKEKDKIFGIRLSFGGHRLVEPKELNGEVDVIDYCEITGIDLRGDSDDFRISISHPEVPFGISTTLYKDDYKDEYCYLNIDTMKSGYDGFYTLKPENWKEDLKRMFEIHLKNKEKYYQQDLKNKEKYYQQDLKILKDKLNLFIQSEDKINEHI